MEIVDTSIAYGVYRIIAPSGSYYIGMTAKSFDERWNGHKVNFRNGQMTCIGLQRAFEKYGLESMIFEVLEDTSGYSDGFTLYRERIWWLRHKAWGANLYNGEPTGRGAVRHTQETRDRISATLRSKVVPIYEIRICAICTKPFEILKRFRQVTCSRSCGNRLGAQRIGRTLSKELSEDDFLTILNMYELDYSLRAIGRELEIGHKQISALLKSKGVEVKRRSGVNAAIWKQAV